MVFTNRIDCIRYLSFGLMIVLWACPKEAAKAQTAISVMELIRPDKGVGIKLPLPGITHDQPRGDNAMVLYDSTYGSSTRTNPYGIEVTAVPLATSLSTGSTGGKTFQVTRVNSAWDCQKNPGLQCGNSAIPAHGIVLSASGDKRDQLKNIHLGDTFVLNESWFKESAVNINVLDPNPTNNPMGSGFPGYRASNQVVVYDNGYGHPNTGTNEFGFEVTVRNGNSDRSGRF